MNVVVDEIEFKRPQDAWRAKLNDQLTCEFCVHMLNNNTGPWCNKRKTWPNNPGKYDNLVSNYVCANFRHSPTLVYDCE